MIKVLALVLALKEYPETTVSSLMSQKEVSTDIIIIGGYPTTKPPVDSGIRWVHVTPNMNEPRGLRLSKAINVALYGVNLKDYDYFLKSDDDVDYYPNYLINNIRADYDLMGAGCSMIMKMDKFVEATGGKLFLCSTEDTYLYAQARALGMNILKWSWMDAPVINRKVRHTFKMSWAAGKDVAGMGDFLPKKKWIRTPIKLLGYLYGIATHYRLPIHDKLMEARNKEKRTILRKLVEL
jgi:hypothetical protein